MNINQRLQNSTAKDTYILLSSQEERADALKNGLISEEDVKRLGAPLSPAERQAFYDSLSFSRLLSIFAKMSIGKTELEMEQITNQLEQLKDEINTLSQAIGGCNELAAKKDSNEQKFRLFDKNGKTITHPLKFDEFLINLEKKYNLKNKNIDIDIFFGTKEGQGLHKDGITASVAIESLRNISSFLDGRIKKLSPEIQKKNADNNTYIELLSFVGKNVTGDKVLNILRNV